MKKRNPSRIISILTLLFIVFTSQTVFTDDTCVFMVTADDIPPNIVLLLDNGAEMEQIIWHANYDNSLDYTPSVGSQVDVVENGTATGNGFFNDNGYSIIETGNKYYLVEVPSNLVVADYGFSLVADGDGKNPVWTINAKTVTLPATPSTVIVDGVKDNATNFRYSKNYLNWIFYSGDYADNGATLPDKSRFYFAKKALMIVAKQAANEAQFGIYNFTSNADGASNVQPLGMVVNTPLAVLPENNTLDSSYVNNINNMGTVTYSPLAEGLASIGGYYSSPSSGVDSSGVVSEYCQKNFAIVVSPGVSSEDQAPAAQSSPSSLSDYDEDNSIDGIVEGEIKEDATVYSIAVNQNGSTYLDDVADYMFTNDIVDYQPGFQNIRTYTVGFMGDHIGNLFLTNTSNNGNGNVNLYDTSHEEYGKYHYAAQDPYDLATALLAAIKDILTATSSFTAPVVPVTRTTSGNRIYMAFFKPDENNFWEGNITKFGISDDNTIIDVNDNAATWPNGAMKEDAEPFWQTKDWADPGKSNYIHNASRNIYTYIGYASDLTDSSNEFVAGNPNLTAAVLGNPTHTTAEIINYIRGADVFDADEDSDTGENRAVITGDVLHSEPMVVQYNFPDNSTTTMVYFGANDGMLHAILDETDPDVDVINDETNHGTEEWAFIPPDQLHRLKDLVEGSNHEYYVDSSPKAYFHDVNGDGLVDTSDGDKVILICGARKGGTSYFALDVTDPSVPSYLWRIDQSNSKTGILELVDISIFSNNGGSFQDGDVLRIFDGAGNWGPDIAAYVDGTMTGYLLRYDTGMIEFNVGQYVGNLTTAVWDDFLLNFGTTPTPFILGQIASITNADPDVIIPELGETWSEPQFGKVKTSDGDTTGTEVFFIGGGYSSDNSVGKAVLAINIMTGAVVKKFTTGMNYSIASTVNAVDADGNGFVDKIYVGDLGGQMWRIGKFTDETTGDTLSFPQCDENIMNWTAEILFVSDPLHQRKFYYPPSVTLEKGYDLVFTGTGDRDDACNTSSSDRIYALKDDHSINDNHTVSALIESDLVNVTDPAAALPNLDSPTADVDLNSRIDQGWYIQLANGEKVLAEGTVFYKTFYITTFKPNTDPCVPSGVGKLYALDYKTAGAVLNFDDDSDPDRSVDVGGGIPSKVVTVITDSGGVKLFISVGSTNPDEDSQALGAGVVAVDPLTPKMNYFRLWWLELLTS
jgi:Tfp pilus tip-associated adhesin PilY1